jgi:hypothetical protein
MEFYSLLDDLSAQDRSALFKEPNAVRTLFRLLSTASQQSAIRLLYGGELSLKELGNQDECLKDLKVRSHCSVSICLLHLLINFYAIDWIFLLLLLFFFVGFPHL